MYCCKIIGVLAMAIGMAAITAGCKDRIVYSKDKPLVIEMVDSGRSYRLELQTNMLACPQDLEITNPNILSAKKRGHYQIITISDTNGIEDLLEKASTLSSTAIPLGPVFKDLTGSGELLYSIYQDIKVTGDESVISKKLGAHTVLFSSNRNTIEIEFYNSFHAANAIKAFNAGNVKVEAHVLKIDD